MKKNLTRILSLLLVLVLMVGVLPVSALADGWDLTGELDTEQLLERAEPVEMQASATVPYRIVHLDCGRKYFSVENIKKLIDTMTNYGYNQLQLAFGNGGCRFLLDDMSLSFAETTMTSDTVKTNITNGNNSFNGDSRYLTQSDMDSIIAYANNKGIEIVPMLNMPGHATAIVYNTSYASNGNLNVNTEAARNYGTALLAKYVTYFKGQGCKYFHFGSDESGYSGGNMTAFLTACAKVITDAGMTPRAFNDATNVATMPKSVQITYWHKETQSKYASALDYAGYKMINTHGRWYYVIKSNQGASEEGTKYWNGTVQTAKVSVELPVMKAEKMDGRWVGINEYFDMEPPFGTTISNSLGTMFCIWCDASQDSYLTDSDVISENENYGALYQLEKMAEHYWPDDIKIPGSTAPTVTLQDGAPVPASVILGTRLTLTANTSVTWTTTDSSVLDLTVPSQTSATKSVEGTEAVAVAVGTGNAEIQVRDADGNTSTYPIAVAQNATQQDVFLTVGEERTFKVSPSVSAASYITGNEAHIAKAAVTAGAAQEPKLQAVTSIESGKSYLILNQRKNLLLTASSTRWTTKGTNCLLLNGDASTSSSDKWMLTGSGTTYTAKFEGNEKYLNIGENTASMSNTSNSLTFRYNNDGYWNISYNDYYLNNLGDTTAAGGWRDSAAPTDAGSRWTIYEIVAGTPTSNTLTITAVGEGDKSVVIGDVTYNIHVTAPSKTDSTTLSHGGSFTLPNGAADVTVTSGHAYVTVNGATITAGKTDGTATITYTVKNDGGYVTARYTHTVTVSAIDFGNIESLPVQLWITNTWVGANSAPTSLQTVNIPARDAYSEAGVALSQFVPSTGYKKDGGDVRVVYWKGVTLHNGIVPVEQGTDCSNSGDNFTTIRYWNNAWQYLNGTEWTTIETTDTIVAYYLQLNNVSPEITTGTKDYGNPPTAHPGKGNYGLTAFAVVYPDGTLSRTEQQMYETGMVCGFWGNTSYGFGTIYAENNSTYRISKMTVTWGANMLGISGDNWYVGDKTDPYGTTWGINWEKKTNSAGAKWYNETTYWKYGDSDIPMIDGDKLGLRITTEKNAALVLIYLEVVETENTLSVVYWDDNANSQITTNPMPLPIVVKPNVTFLNGIQNSGEIHPGDITLSDEAYIENSSGATQKFNKELSTVPGVGGAYLSGMYKYVGAKVSEDGLTLTLHFDLNEAQYQQTFVVDFGLPLVIRATDFGLENTDRIQSVSLERGNLTLTHEGTYGTATIADNYQTVTYTLKKPLGSGRATIPLFVRYQNETEPRLFQAHVIPASNILYEENFLTQAEDTNANRLPWALDTAGSLGSTKQATHKNDVEAIFGYDDAYKNSTGSNGAWKVSNLSKESSVSKPLTAEFYGNALDVIGTCDANTAMLMMIISNVDNPSAAKKPVLVDTRYNGGTLNQVPFAHVELESDAHYSVMIRAYYAPAIAASNTNTAATFGAVSAISDFAASASYADQAVWSQMAHDLAEDGLSLDDVEFVRFDDTASAAQTDSFAVYADLYSVQQPARPEGTNLAIDAFRVYRSSDSNDAIGEKYIASEQNIVYNNILDVVMGKIVAFTEGDPAKEIAITDYEAAGGPQNEIYLPSGQSVGFKVDNAVDTIQVSLRAVQGATSWADATTGENPTAISSNTEMYYTVHADANGVFTITNRGTGLLAIGNVKLPSNAKTTSASEIDEDALRASLCAALGLSAEQPQAFQPKTFTARATTLPMLRNKRVSVLITISNDVSYVTVNGVKYTPSRYYASWQKTRLIQFGETLGKYESKTYTIIAYDANGVASAPITVNG